jgi:predicted nucleotidyltransferase
MEHNEDILREIKKTIEELEPQAEIILYGSRARGEEGKESDWDLLILLPYSSSLKLEQKFRHTLFDIELKFGQAISTLVKSKREWEGKFQITPLYQSIIRERVAL